MKFKTLILLLLVVVLPTALLSWGGFQLAQQQSDQFEIQVKGLMQDQLVELDSRISRYFTVQEAYLQKETGKEFESIDAIRETADSIGVVDNIFIISADNILAYPNPISPLNQREIEFFAKIKTIVEDGEIQNQVLQTASKTGNTTNNYVANDKTQNAAGNLGQTADDSNAPSEQLEEQGDENPSGGQQGGESQNGENQNRGQQSGGQQSESQQLNLPQGLDPNPYFQNLNSSNRLPQSVQRGAPLQSTAQTFSQPSYEPCEGWFIWYWGRGVNLIFWQRLASGDVICVALERSRWMSDLIAELPDSVVADSEVDKVESGQARVRSTKIVNSSGESVYLWGNDASDDMVLAAEIPVSHPLASWKLQMWVEPEELKSQNLVGLNIIAGIVASSIALIAVAWIFYREYTKDLKEASKRVSFVNQVSHELRTPLTNIRMYAELLNKEISELEGLDAEKAKKRIEVVESESNRLSRLISNVLSFAGSQKNSLEVRLANGVIDDCVQNVVSSFAPNLEKLGIKIKTDLQAGAEVKFDSDLLGQMIGNLISNVEKYASEGEFIEISTRLDGKQAVVTIRDDGFGIDPKFAEQIFEPFWRMSNELQHASGTGIGLSISRELARMHGGDLTLEASDKGAKFVIRIKVEEL